MPKRYRVKLRGDKPDALVGQQAVFAAGRGDRGWLRHRSASHESEEEKSEEKEGEVVDEAAEEVLDYGRELGRGKYGVVATLRFDDVMRSGLVFKQGRWDRDAIGLFTPDELKASLIREREYFERVHGGPARLELYPDGAYCMVLKRLPGETLFSKLRAAGQDYVVQLSLIYAAVQAIVRLHREHGLDHRDCHLKNVLIDGDGSAESPFVAHLVDFGWARPRDHYDEGSPKRVRANCKDWRSLLSDYRRGCGEKGEQIAPRWRPFLGDLVLDEERALAKFQQMLSFELVDQFDLKALVREAVDKRAWIQFLCISDDELLAGRGERPLVFYKGGDLVNSVMWQYLRQTLLMEIFHQPERLPGFELLLPFAGAYSLEAGKESFIDYGFAEADWDRFYQGLLAQYGQSSGPIDASKLSTSNKHKVRDVLVARVIEECVVKELGFRYLLRESPPERLRVAYLNPGFFAAVDSSWDEVSMLAIKQMFLRRLERRGRLSERQMTFKQSVEAIATKEQAIDVYNEYVLHSLCSEAAAELSSPPVEVSSFLKRGVSVRRFLELVQYQASLNRSGRIAKTDFICSLCQLEGRDTNGLLSRVLGVEAVEQARVVREELAAPRRRRFFSRGGSRRFKAAADRLLRLVDEAQYRLDERELMRPG